MTLYYRENGFLESLSRYLFHKRLSIRVFSQSLSTESFHKSLSRYLSIRVFPDTFSDTFPQSLSTRVFPDTFSESAVFFSIPCTVDPTDLYPRNGTYIRWNIARHYLSKNTPKTTYREMSDILKNQCFINKRV